MRLILIALAMSFTLPALAQTNWTERKMGGTTYYEGTDRQGGRVHGTSRRLGNTTYGEFYDNQGGIVRCTSRPLGSTVYTNCRP